MPRTPGVAGAPSPTSPSPMSPSGLPTLARPTAPPSSPTDPTPRGVVAGRVTKPSDACVEVRTDDGVTWSLVGESNVALKVGDTVTARVADAVADDGASGPGRQARLVSIRVVGQ